MPDEDVRRLTRGGAMTRAKLVGLRRNLAIALGNSGDAATAAALDEASDGRASTLDPLVARHVRWARDKMK